MNKEIMINLGFEGAVECVNQLKCPFCKQVVDVDAFDDELSVKEFSISGLCQACQNAIFECFEILE